jgi:hypothetical protein
MEDALPQPSKTPVHLWIVGVVSLLWNCFGCFDYTMTNLRDPDYLAQFPPEMMQIIDAFPIWASAAWACGVWGALAGSVLLLARSRWAVAAFAISLAGLAISTLYQLGVDMPAELQTPGMMFMNILIWSAATFLLIYSVSMKRKGVLR